MTGIRAVLLEGYGGPDRLRLAELAPPPAIRDDEVRIEVHAAGINPFDLKLRCGCLRETFPLPPGHVLGNDVAGRVIEKGFDVADLEIGDRIYGLLDPMRPGAYAEQVVSPAWLVRRMPANLGFAEAAAVPMPACTAWVGLVDLARIGPGCRVLVTGAAGGVGCFAVQIARHRGAWVAATASPERADRVRGLGAELVIDPDPAALAGMAGRFDVVIDTVGGETNLACYPLLRRGGTMLVVVRRDRLERANRQRLMAAHGVTTRVIAFGARPDILDAMRPLFEAGALRPPEIRLFPLERAAAAHALVENGGLRGKAVLEVQR